MLSILVSITLLLSGQTSSRDSDPAISYSASGDRLQADRRFADAEKDYRKAIALLRQQRERTHDAAVVWRHLAASFTADGRYREALSALKQASNLASKDKVQDPCLDAQVLNNLGFIYYNQGKLDKAEKLLLRASELQFISSNLVDVDRWQILNNLGRLYQKTPDYGKSEDFYSRALQLAEARHGQSNPVLSVVLVNLGILYVQTGRYKEAESRFQTSLAILEHSQLSFDGVLLMRALYGLGETYRRENDPLQAGKMLARAADIGRRLGRASEMPEVVEVLEAYARVLNDLSHSSEAERLAMEAQRIRASLEYSVPVQNAN